MHTSNNKVYSETGRYPLFINHNIRCIKYWLRIKSYSQNRIVNQSYKCLLNLNLKGKNNWVTSVQNVLCSNGYGVVWLFGEVGHTVSFFTKLKQTLIDSFNQGWNSDMSSNANCSFYYGFKPIIETELYLRNHNLKLHLRNVLVKFRLGVSEIYCHRYKYSKNIDLMRCPFCVRNHLQDEFHILFTCPMYMSIRDKYFKNLFPLLLNDQIKVNEFIVNQWYIISKYLHEMFALRKGVLDLRILK